MHTFGGVARNVAECMTRLGTPPFFISAVGNDQNGRLITGHLEESGMVRETSMVIVKMFVCSCLDPLHPLLCSLSLSLSLSLSASVWVL